MLKCLLGASYRAATSTDLPWQETRLASERTSGLRVPRRTIVRASPVDNSSPARGEKSLSLPRPVQLHGAMARMVSIVTFALRRTCAICWPAANRGAWDTQLVDNHVGVPICAIAGVRGSPFEAGDAAAIFRLPTADSLVMGLSGLPLFPGQNTV